MNRKRLRNDKRTTLPAGLTIGLGVSVGITFLMCAVSAWLILRGSVQESAVGYISLVILMLSAIGGAVSASVAVKERRLIVCVCSGGLYIAFLLGCTAMLFGGEYQAVAVTCLAAMGASVCAGLVMSEKTHKKTSKIRTFR